MSFGQIYSRVISTYSSIFGHGLACTVVMLGWCSKLLLQKQICSTVTPIFALLFEPLGHCRNVANLSLFYRYYLVDVHLNWVNWFHLLILVGGPLIILIDCMIFLPPFLDVMRMFMSTVSFLTRLDSKILYLQGASSDLALSIELRDTFYLWVLSK